MSPFQALNSQFKANQTKATEVTKACQTLVLSLHFSEHGSHKHCCNASMKQPNLSFESYFCICVYVGAQGLGIKAGRGAICGGAIAQSVENPGYHG